MHHISSHLGRTFGKATGSRVQFDFPDGPVSVNVPDAASAVGAVRARLAAGEGFALATLNLDHLVKLRRDAGFRAAYRAQDLVTADGNPVVWLSRLAGAPVTLAPGADMVVPLVRAAAEAGRPVSMVGSTADALERAAAALDARVPGFRRGLLIAPRFGFDPAGAEADDILARLGEAGPQLCLLALGAPRQECLAARGRALAPAVGFASVGAGVDFLAGTQHRAPGFVRAARMEWAWRAARDPGRLAGRYASCMAILPGLAVSAVRRRGR